MERDKRNEEYYQRMDALLRKKAGRVKKEKVEKNAKLSEVKNSNRKEKSEIKVTKPAKMVMFKKKRHLL